MAKSSNVKVRRLPGRDGALLSFVCEQDWGLQETVAERFLEILARHAIGEKLPADEVDLIVRTREEGREADNDGRRAEPAMTIEDGVAVIPVFGVLAKHASMVNGISQPQGSSVERIAADFRGAMEDPRVKSWLLHIESPGGMVAGISELADAMRSANAEKPGYAFVDDLGCSCAYWLASQAAGGVFATKTAATGSIGVMVILADSSARTAEKGLKMHAVKSGAKKALLVDGMPIGEEALAEVQDRVNALAGVFMAEVAAGRGMDLKDVQAIADGRVYTGLEAVEAGLIDGIKSYEQVLALARDGARIPGKKRRAGRDESATAGQTETGLDGDPDMASEKESPKAITAADVDAARAEALAGERKRAQGVTRILAGYPDLLEKALADGACNEVAATAMLVPVLQARIDAQAKELADANARLKVIGTNGGQKPVAQDSTASGKAGDEAPAPGSKAADKGDDGKSETYVAKVAELAKTGGHDGHPTSMDYRNATVALPESFAAWKDANAVPPRG